jgi:hypothetical protein
VSQASFYVKRNPLIPGLADATTWLYDTTQVDLVNADFDPTLFLEFEGAQLVDSEGLCLTRGENPTQDLDNNDEFVIYTATCIDYLGDIEDAENIDAIKRQTWIIENTPFTDTHFIIRATCEEKAIKRFMDKRTYEHSS